MKRILTADDSASMRKMVSFTLKKVGFDVFDHTDGVEALDWANGNKADLVITDINMPNMDGYELIQALRLLPDYKFIPILALTTESSAEAKMKGKSVGATGWIIKPFNPDQLISIVSKVLDV